MLIKAICNFFNQKPTPIIDKNIQFFRFSPDKEVGIFFSDQQGLEFEKVTDSKPSREIPPELLRNRTDSTLTSGTGLTKGDYVRLIYFVFLEDGDILTVSFQTAYVNNNDARDWAIGKANKLNALKMNAEKIVKFYNNDPQKMSRGLDQDFSRSSLIFFYVCNRHMEFTKEKFSCVAMPNNPPSQHKNPFEIIASTDNNFFALYNLFEPDTSSTGFPYGYKFNLHMKTKGYTIDTPTLIPFIVDPEFGNKGPPS
jgi:hypothetical protein